MNKKLKSVLLCVAFAVCFSFQAFGVNFSGLENGKYEVPITLYHSEKDSVSIGNRYLVDTGILEVTDSENYIIIAVDAVIKGLEFSYYNDGSLNGDITKNESIENNIKIANLDASHEDVVNAAKMASIHSFIMSLPNGYETNVSELGDLLSDGEKQRLGLARVFLSNSPLILLDEPTSNLDCLNEGNVLRSLDSVRNEKSIVLISHRMSTKGIADKSYTVFNGRLS